MKVSRRECLRGSALAVVLPLAGGAGTFLAVPHRASPGPAGVTTIWDMSFWSKDAGFSAGAVRATLLRRIEVPRWHPEFS